MGVCFLSIFVSLMLRNHVVAPYIMPNSLVGTAGNSGLSLALYALCPLASVLALHLMRHYEASNAKTLRYFVATLVGSLLAMVIGFLVSGKFLTEHVVRSQDSVSRGLLLIYPFVGTLLLFCKEFVLSRLLHRHPPKWRIAVVCDTRTLEVACDFVCTGSGLQTDLAACFLTDLDKGSALSDKAVMPLSELLEFLKSTHVDEVVFAAENVALSELTPYFEELETMGVKTQLLLTFFRQSIGTGYLHHYRNRMSGVTFSPVRDMSFALFAKEAFDRVCALLMLVLLAPVFVVLSLLVKLTSDKLSDPVFYGQTRSGLNGKTFKLWKFRSMHLDADKRKADLMEHNIMGGPTFKMKHDPRVTRIGNILRKTSLDELPQIWNVLIGDMSLVGPRPALPTEVAQYDRWQRRRLSMKPGITCLWQVMGRNHLAFEKWMKLDLEYIDNWSLRMDLVILLRTIYVVFTGYGAM